MAVLILSSEDDPHAVTVRNALQCAGEAVDMLSPTAMLTGAELRYEFDGMRAVTNYAYRDTVLRQDYSCAWLRRARFPPLLSFDPRDRGYAERELQHFLTGFLDTLATQYNWVNTHWAARRANNKLRQLRTASQVGFRAPATFISTSLGAVRERALQWGGPVLLKPLNSMAWHENGGNQVSAAVIVKQDAWPTSEEFRGPILIQPFISKKFEVRIFVAGQEILGLRINSNVYPETMVDFRVGFSTNRIDVEPAVIPIDIEERIRKYTDMSGLVTASFDFIITPEGDWVFLECNESGNFLWMEEMCPTLKALSTFCEFLLWTGPPQDFRRTGLMNELRFDEIVKLTPPAQLDIVNADALILTPDNYALPREVRWVY